MTLMISGGGGGGGGATALGGLSDVTLGVLANGQILQYNSGSGQWENTALTGQLTYKGAFDASTGTPALTNALKGDFYVISVAGTQFGQSWSIGDHLIVNADMGGVIDPAKIDKIDNTETGLQAVVDDTTPQLGGALDVNGNAIVSAAAGDIAITPDTTGNIVLDGLNWPQADGANGQVLQTNGAGQLSFTNQAAGLAAVVDDTTPQLGGALDVNGNAIVSAAAGDIAITPDTTGSIVLDGLNWPQADGANGQVLVTDGAGQLSFTNQAAGLAAVVDDTTPQLGGALDVNGNAIVSAAAGNIAITPDTTGSIVLDGLNWPQADGANGQVLVTDGAGQLSFTNQAAGLADVVDDTTPQLGGALDVNGNAIVSAAAGNIAITPDTTGSIVLDGLNWPQADGANGQVLVTNGAGQLSFANQTGLTDVVDDTTPQLGGALDVNGNAIVSAAAGDIAITPDTTGSIVLDGLNWPQADGANGQVLVTNGAGQLSFTNQAAGLADVVDDTTPQLGGNLDVNGNAIVSAAAGNIAITPDTTGSIVLDGLNWPQADGSANQVLVTNGAGQLSFANQTGLTDVVDDTTPQLGGALDVNGNAIVSAAAGNIAITPDTTGSIVLDGLNWPQADGTTGQVLQTDGAGQLSFTTVSAGGSRPGVYTQSASFTIGDGTGTDPGAVGSSELERVYLINNGASAVTVTLPAISGNVGAGFKLQIKRLGTATVTIDRNSEDIDDQAVNQTLSVQYSSFTLVCAGAGVGWYII